MAGKSRDEYYILEEGSAGTGEVKDRYERTYLSVTFTKTHADISSWIGFEIRPLCFGMYVCLSESGTGSCYLRLPACCSSTVSICCCSCRPRLMG